MRFQQRQFCTATKSHRDTDRGAGSMGHGGHVPPPLSIMAGHGGHREQNIKQEIAKYFLS